MLNLSVRSIRGSSRTPLAAIVAVIGVVAVGCVAPPSLSPVDKVIRLSDTCTLEVRLGGDADGSFLAARSVGLCQQANPYTGTASEWVSALRLETTAGVQTCEYGDVYQGPGTCTTYTEGLPGQPFATWLQATAPGSMVRAEVWFSYYDAEYHRVITVWP